MSNDLSKATNPRLKEVVSTHLQYIRRHSDNLYTADNKPTSNHDHHQNQINQHVKALHAAIGEQRTTGLLERMGDNDAKREAMRRGKAKKSMAHQDYPIVSPETALLENYLQKSGGSGEKVLRHTTSGLPLHAPSEHNGYTIGKTRSGRPVHEDGSHFGLETKEDFEDAGSLHGAKAAHHRTKASAIESRRSDSSKPSKALHGHQSQARNHEIHESKFSAIVKNHNFAAKSMTYKSDDALRKGSLKDTLGRQSHLWAQFHAAHAMHHAVMADDDDVDYETKKHHEGQFRKHSEAVQELDPKGANSLMERYHPSAGNFVGHETAAAHRAMRFKKSENDHTITLRHVQPEGKETLGSTRSGKPVYKPSSRAYAKVRSVQHTNESHARGRAKIPHAIQSVIRQHGSYTAQDHADAAHIHDLAGNDTLAEVHQMAHGYLNASKRRAKKSMHESASLGESIGERLLKSFVSEPLAKAINHKGQNVKVAGVTRSGKAVYGIAHPAYNHIPHTEKENPEHVFPHAQKIEEDGHYAHFTPEDHDDADKIHSVIASRAGRRGGKRNAVAHAHGVVAEYLRDNAEEGVAKSLAKSNGHIVGKTDSGKDIYGEDHPAYSKLKTGNDAHNTVAVNASPYFRDYTDQDHHDAAEHHSSLSHAKGSRKHFDISGAHYGASDPEDRDLLKRSMQQKFDHQSQSTASQAASAQSDRAEGMTKLANKSPNRESHIKAAEAHKHAKDLATRAKQPSLAAYHHGMAEKHLGANLQPVKKSSAHRDLAGEYFYPIKHGGLHKSEKGRRLGRTDSGVSVYAKVGADHYPSMSERDHLDAASLHHEASALLEARRREIAGTGRMPRGGNARYNAISHKQDFHEMLRDSHKAAADRASKVKKSQGAARNGGGALHKADAKTSSGKPIRHQDHKAYLDFRQGHDGHNAKLLASNPTFAKYSSQDHLDAAKHHGNEDHFTARTQAIVDAHDDAATKKGWDDFDSVQPGARKSVNKSLALANYIAKMPGTWVNPMNVRLANN